VNRGSRQGGRSLRFTGSLVTKLGIYAVSICELAQFLKNNLGKNSRFLAWLRIM
jgi:hypothetical protein